MNERDYTKLPLGSRLADGREIERCPICGRPGVVFETDTFESAEHSRLEKFVAANGEKRGKYALPRATCHRNK